MTILIVKTFSSGLTCPLVSVEERSRQRDSAVELYQLRSPLAVTYGGIAYTSSFLCPNSVQTPRPCFPQGHQLADPFWYVAKGMSGCVKDENPWNHSVFLSSPPTDADCRMSHHIQWQEGGFAMR